MSKLRILLNYWQPKDLPDNLLAQIKHFFEHYKDLEPDKWVKVADWVGAEDAKKEIIQGIARLDIAKNKS